MKTFIALFMSSLILCGSFGLVMAQEPTVEAAVVATATPDAPEPPVSPPATTQDLVNGITALIAGAAGYLASLITGWIKKIPMLSDGDKSKLEGATAEVVAVIVSVLTGFAVATVAQGLDLIPDSGLQALVISLAAPIVSELRYRLVKLSPSDARIAKKV